MKLAYLEVDGFRGYNKPLRVDFGDQFTIIDGRNGAGKSTIFDAIEYALTGRLGKQKEQKAAGETIADYVWWRGAGTPPRERFVRVVFKNGDREISVTRSEFRDPDEDDLERLAASLCDRKLAPKSALFQLCKSSIIRDEQITQLSLDMKETDRYSLLREALGAADSDRWIDRGNRLLTASKRRVDSADSDVATANVELSHATRKLDEITASIVAEKMIAAAISRLQEFAKTSVSPDELSGVIREHLVTVATKIDLLKELGEALKLAEQDRVQIGVLTEELNTTKSEHAEASSALQALPAAADAISASKYEEEAKDLITLVALGRRLGLREEHCPLCGKTQSSRDFEKGIEKAESIAQRLNSHAAKATGQEQVRRDAEQRLLKAAKSLAIADREYTKCITALNSIDEKRQRLGLLPDAGIEETNSQINELRKTVERVDRDLKVLDTLRLSSDLVRAKRDVSEAKRRLSVAQAKSGQARKAQARAQTLYDAARRAASETLDRRLERVLPLMSELYQRLRPHPYWRDIEYSIRGDVRKFLRLQVGETLNPQFLFSSGQRRATGLAFLLSVSLSLAWSKWQSILLDDPVQHVDDFRAVNLAELLGQLVADGRQVVCAVEDAALADLLCRRLPVKSPSDATRFTLGPDEEGTLVKLREDLLDPHILNAAISQSGEQPQAI